MAYFKPKTVIQHDEYFKRVDRLHYYQYLLKRTPVTQINNIRFYNKKIYRIQKLL